MPYTPIHYDEIVPAINNANTDFAKEYECSFISVETPHTSKLKRLLNKACRKIIKWLKRNFFGEKRSRIFVHNKYGNGCHDVRRYAEQWTISRLKFNRNLILRVERYRKDS